jgi:hypothetical protein
LESNSSIFVDFSMDRNAYQSYDQVSDHFDHAVVVDCIDNYMFLAGPNYDALNLVVQLPCDHSYEEETATVDDQEFVSKEQGGHLFATRETFTKEQPSLLKKPKFYHVIHDPIAIYMESYVSDFLKISNCIISPILTGKYGFMNDLMLLLLYFFYYSLISGIDEIISVIKLLEWLLWKSTFT